MPRHRIGFRICPELPGRASPAVRAALAARVVLVALVWALWSAQAAAQGGLLGAWSGEWEREGSTLQVEMTFTRGASGYEGSFSSRQLRVVGIPLTRIGHEGTTIRWQIVGDASTYVFEGTLRGDTMKGRFREGSASGTFRFSRSTASRPVLREDEITFKSGPVTLSGTIVSPTGSGPFPGVVFIHGSGAEGRWASRYLAQELATRGVAALIYDKRGVGRSTGDWRSSDFTDLVSDAAAAVEVLASRPYVSADRVGIHGHSQGGTIAPWAASRNPRVAFVVASAGSGLPMAETEIYSVENSLNVRAMPETDRRLAERFVRVIVATAYGGAPRSELDRVVEEVRGRPWAFELPPPSDFYWSFSRRIASYDPLEHWRQVAVPVLLLYGERDERVPPRPSAARIAEAYLAGKGSRLDVALIPEGDHTYRVPGTANGPFRWPKTATGYPDRLIDWVLEISKRPAP